MAIRPCSPWAVSVDWQACSRWPMVDPTSCCKGWNGLRLNVSGTITPIVRLRFLSLFGAQEASLVPTVRRRLFTILESYLRSHDDVPTWQELFREEVSDEIVVNTLSTYLECTPLEKQFLLEADSLHQQARRLSDLIEFMMHDQSGAKGWG